MLDKYIVPAGVDHKMAYQNCEAVKLLPPPSFEAQHLQVQAFAGQACMESLTHMDVCQAYRHMLQHYRHYRKPDMQSRHAKKQLHLEQAFLGRHSL